MSIIEATLLLLFMATIAVPWARRTGIPTEILLVIGSLVVSLLPGLKPIILDPTVVFALFLPPILFAAAYFTSWRDFKRNQKPIFLLAVGLVLFTTTLVGIALHFIVPGMPWPVAFLLGAIVSPPDASAATAIVGKLGVPRRLLTIIEGESLVNDATALVAYKFALAAIVTGAFSLKSAAVQFLLVAAGGAAIGIAVGFAGMFIVKRLNNSTAETTLSLITSFAAYLAAEHLGFSGVISTVVSGFYFGRKIPIETSAQTRIEAEASWNTVLFIVNGLVFTLIGLQLPAVMAGLGEYSWAQLALYATGTTVVVIGVRFIWVFPSIAGRGPTPQRGVAFVLSWIGMRGIVSLAAALSIPLLLPSGEVFPFRDLLIFLTYVVILATLLIPAATLPWLIRWLGLKGEDENQRDETVARLALLQAGLRKVEALGGASGFQAETLEAAARRYQRGIQTLESNLEAAAFSPLFDEEQRKRQMVRMLLEAERKELGKLRQDATIHDAVFFMLSHELDIEETRLNTQRV